MTRIPFARVALLSLLVAATAAPAVAQKKSQDKPVLYAVVQVDQEYRIVTKAGVAELKKELKAEHKKAVAEHKEAAKEAKKNKEKFSTPAPKAKKMKVVKPSIDKEGAEKLIAELQAKADKKGEPKKDAKPKKAKKAKKEPKGSKGK
jgi:hypothetical protein